MRNDVCRLITALQSLYKPLIGLIGLQEVKAPRFLDNRHINVVNLSALNTDRLYPLGNIGGTYFL
jgi:hypothetical protein